MIQDLVEDLVRDYGDDICGGVKSVSGGGMRIMSCGVPGIITALVFVVVGCFAFEILEPVREVSGGRNNESRALWLHP